MLNSPSRTAGVSVEVWAMRDGGAAMYDRMSRVTHGVASTTGGYAHASQFSPGDPGGQSTVLLKGNEYVNVLVSGTANLPYDTEYSDALAARAASHLG
jgi:hypothetical protein